MNSFALVRPAGVPGGVVLFVAALLFFTLFSPGFEPGESAKTIKGAAYFLHYGKFATLEVERLAQAGELTIGPGRTGSFRYGGPVLFFQFAGVMWLLERLIGALSPYPPGSPEFWYAVGFGLSILPAVWSALTVLGVWLALRTLGVPSRHRLLACALLAMTSHQLVLSKTAYDGIFLGTLGIFAVWCGLLGRARVDSRGTGFVVLAGLLAGLGFATKASGVLLAFPLGLLVFASRAPMGLKTWRALLIGGGLLLGLAGRVYWNLVMGDPWSYLGAGTLGNWATGLGGYSLERIAVYLFSPALSIFVHSPTLLLLFMFGLPLYRFDPLLFMISGGTLLLSVTLHSQNLWEFLAAQNFSGRFNVWALPIAYLALGHLPRAVCWARPAVKGAVVGLVGFGLAVSVASGLANWPYRAAWLTQQHLTPYTSQIDGTREGTREGFNGLVLAKAWEPKYSLPLDAVAQLPRNLARIAGHVPPELVRGASPINQGMSNGLSTWWFALILMGFNLTVVLLLVSGLVASVVLLSVALWNSREEIV